MPFWHFSLLETACRVVQAGITSIEKIDHGSKALLKALPVCKHEDLRAVGAAPAPCR